MEKLPVQLSVCAIMKATPLQSASYTLIFLLEGQLQIETSTDGWTLHDGDLILLGPEDETCLKACGPNKALMIDIEDTFLQQITGTAAPIFLLNTTVNRCDCAELVRLLHQLLAFQTDGGADELIETSLVFELMFLLKSKYLLSEEGPGISETSRAAEIKKYIMLHYTQRLTLEKTAAHFGLTAPYFSRYFKKQFDMTFLEYLTDTRLRHAYRKLVTTGRDITSIALESGFSNLSGFYRAFQKTYHMAPRQARVRESREDTMKAVSTEEAMSLIDAHGYSTDAGAQVDTEFLRMNVRLGEAYPQSWGEILNLGYAMNCLKWDFQHQIHEILNRIKFHYVRIEGVLWDQVAPPRERGAYDFSYLEQIIIMILDSGCLPFLELSGEDRLKHSEKLRKFLSWLAGRWRVEELTQWRFSLSIGAGLDGNAYCETVMQARALFRTLLPTVELGGLGVSDALPTETLHNLLTQLQKIGGELDFLTITHDPVYREEKQFDGTMVQQRIYEGTADGQRISQTRAVVERMLGAGRPFYVTAANCEHLPGRTASDSCQRAAWFVRTALACDVDALGYGMFSDLQMAAADPSRPVLFGGHGMLTVNSLPKPIYFAVHMMQAAGAFCIRRGEHFIATSREDGTMVVLMHNHKPFSPEYLRRPEEVSLSDSCGDLRKLHLLLLLEELKPGRYAVKSTSLNGRSGCILHAIAAFGKDRDLSRRDYDYLRSTTMPAQQYREVVCDTSFQIEALLEPNEVRLVEIVWKE